LILACALTLIVFRMASCFEVTGNTRGPDLQMHPAKKAEKP